MLLSKEDYTKSVENLLKMMKSENWDIPEDKVIPKKFRAKNKIYTSTDRYLKDKMK